MWSWVGILLFLKFPTVRTIIVWRWNLSKASTGDVGFLFFYSPWNTLNSSSWYEYRHYSWYQWHYRSLYLWLYCWFIPLLSFPAVCKAWNTHYWQLSLNTLRALKNILFGVLQLKLQWVQWELITLCAEPVVQFTTACNLF